MSSNIESHFNALLDSTTDRISSRDNEGGLIVWNKAFGDSIRLLFGVEPQVGLKPWDLIPPTEQEKLVQLRASFRQVYSGKPTCGEYEYPYPDGTIHFLQSTWSPIWEGNEIIAVAEITRDITEIKKSEENLHSSTKRFQAFMKNSTEAIWCFEITPPVSLDLTEEQQLEHIYKYSIVVEANDAWAEYVGYERGEDIIGMKLDNLVPLTIPENVEVVKKIIRAKYNVSGVKTYEFSTDGEPRIVYNNMVSNIVNGHVGRVWGTARDITEQENSKQKLLEAEEKYRTVADFNFDWEYWQNPDGSFNYVSPSSKLITGYEPEEFFDNKFLITDIIIDEDKATWEWHSNSTRQDEERRVVQFRIKRKDDQIRWIEHACQTVTNEAGEFLGYRASNRDISDRKKAEEDANRLRNEYLHIARVATVGELTASLAHELKQPLAAIRSNAQAAQRFLTGDKPDLDEFHEILKDIVKDNRRADNVIVRLQSLMRKGELSVSELDINEVVQDVLPLIHSYEIMRNISVEFKLNNRLPEVLADRVQLQQVLLNLILNSSEALMRVDKELKEIIVETDFHDSKNIFVAIKDNGPGVVEKNIECLFEPFYSTKKDGMGMGLSICQSIIAAHKGEIWAANNSQGGVTFNISLPVVKRNFE